MSALPDLDALRRNDSAAWKRHVHHRSFVHDQNVAVERTGLIARERACSGLHFKQAVEMVLASMPLASERRLAARPGGSAQD
jgi:hypothetical protein